MVTWNTTAPDGSKSVAANNTILQQNTTYTETVQNYDHYWNIGTDEDGHHKYVQTVGYASGGTPTDPTIATGMDAVYYAKLKTASEATAQQDVQPYYKNAGQVMQILAMRACVCFDVSSGSVTVKYKHNITSVSRTAQGRFTVTFTNAMPSVNYLVAGSAIRDTSSATSNIFFVPDSASNLSSVKTTSTFKFHTPDTESNLRDPLQCWVVFFGG